LALPSLGPSGSRGASVAVHDVVGQILEVDGGQYMR